MNVNRYFSWLDLKRGLFDKDQKAKQYTHARLLSVGFEKLLTNKGNAKTQNINISVNPFALGNPSKVIYLGRLLVFGLTLGCPGLALLAPVYPFHLPLSAEWVSSYYTTGLDVHTGQNNKQAKRVL